MGEIGEAIKALFVGSIILAVIIGGLGAYLLIKFFGA